MEIENKVDMIMADKQLNKILYVEDDPSVQAVVKISLVNIGKFAIKECWNGKEALEKIEDFMPDLILSDVMMPEMDGVTMLKKLRDDSRYDNIPLIFISARAQKHEVDEYLNLGAVHVLTKPFDPVTLPNQLKEIWEKINP